MKLPEDPFILELLPEFVDTWIVDLDEQYHKFLLEKNNDELYRLAHTIKGSCFQFGLDHIAQIGLDIMAALKENNWEKAAECEQPMKDAFAEAKIYLAEKGIK
jgi:HPt (histidine-containing phosphotransfer) domain-containing protein